MLIVLLSTCKDPQSPLVPDTDTYKVTYHGNGFTSGTVPEDNREYKSGADVTVLGNPGNLTRSLDTFEGWCVNFDGSGETYTSGNTFKMGSSNITLYAKWSQKYSLRDTGPAGGFIFYINANSTASGWRYLEAAPADQTSRPWGTYGLSVTGAGGTEVGTGKQNTIDIIDGDTRENKAADECETYSRFNGTENYEDWFLPSEDELYEMYTVLKQEDMGGFVENYYWSSTEGSANLGRGVNFGSGLRGGYHKNQNYRVRPVRSF